MLLNTLQKYHVKIQGLNALQAQSQLLRVTREYWGNWVPDDSSKTTNHPAEKVILFLYARHRLRAKEGACKADMAMGNGGLDILIQAYIDEAKKEKIDCSEGLSLKPPESYRTELIAINAKLQEVRLQEEGGKQRNVQLYTTFQHMVTMWKDIEADTFAQMTAPEKAQLNAILEKDTAVDTSTKGLITLFKQYEGMLAGPGFSEEALKTIDYRLHDLLQTLAELHGKSANSAEQCTVLFEAIVNVCDRPPPHAIAYCLHAMCGWNQDLALKCYEPHQLQITASMTSLEAAMVPAYTETLDQLKTHLTTKKAIKAQVQEYREQREGIYAKAKGIEEICTKIYRANTSHILDEIASEICGGSEVIPEDITACTPVGQAQAIKSATGTYNEQLSTQTKEYCIAKTELVLTEARRIAKEACDTLEGGASASSLNKDLQQQTAKITELQKQTLPDEHKPEQALDRLASAIKLNQTSWGLAKEVTAYWQKKASNAADRVAEISTDYARHTEKAAAVITASAKAKADDTGPQDAKQLALAATQAEQAYYKLLVTDNMAITKDSLENAERYIDAAKQCQAGGTDVVTTLGDLEIEYQINLLKHNSVCVEAKTTVLALSDSNAHPCMHTPDTVAQTKAQAEANQALEAKALEAVKTIIKDYEGVINQHLGSIAKLAEDTNEMRAEIRRPLFLQQAIVAKAQQFLASSQASDSSAQAMSARLASATQMAIKIEEANEGYTGAYTTTLQQATGYYKGITTKLGKSTSTSTPSHQTTGSATQHLEAAKKTASDTISGACEALQTKISDDSKQISTMGDLLNKPSIACVTADLREAYASCHVKLKEYAGVVQALKDSTNPTMVVADSIVKTRQNIERMPEDRQGTEAECKTRLVQLQKMKKYADQIVTAEDKGTSQEEAPSTFDQDFVKAVTESCTACDSVFDTEKSRLETEIQSLQEDTQQNRPIQTSDMVQKEIQKQQSDIRQQKESLENILRHGSDSADEGDGIRKGSGARQPRKAEKKYNVTTTAAIILCRGNIHNNEETIKKSHRTCARLHLADAITQLKKLKEISSDTSKYKEEDANLTGDKYKRYLGKYKKQLQNYENAKHSTHQSRVAFEVQEAIWNPALFKNEVNYQAQANDAYACFTTALNAAQDASGIEKAISLLLTNESLQKFGNSFEAHLFHYLQVLCHFILTVAHECGICDKPAWEASRKEAFEDMTTHIQRVTVAAAA